MMRIKNKILNAVDRLQLNLTNKVVLTEAATAAYSVTPVIAALAGAEVFAFTKSTRYGSINDVKEQTYGLLNELNIDHSKVTVIDEITPAIIGKTDVITNSGHLRPLDKQKLQYVKNDVVIPLMYEAWERREADLEFDFCKAKRIQIGATNERHPDVDVFNYLGDMALKMIFDAGLNVYNNTFLLFCNNDFGPFIAKVVSQICKSFGVCDKEENKNKYAGLDIDWIGGFPDLQVPEKYKKCDAVIFTAYPFDKPWIAATGTPILISQLKEQLETPYLLRYAGDIIEKDCLGEVDFFPSHVGSGHMGVLPSAIGYDPIINLQAGGLKVAELMMKGETKYKGIDLASIL